MSGFLLIKSVYDICFFIFLMESTSDPDMKIIKKCSILNFLHRVLAVHKREISLPDGSQTAQSADHGDSRAVTSKQER